MPLVEQLFVTNHGVILPIVFHAYGGDTRPDDTFGQARPLTLNVAQSRNFDHSLDLYDVYYFDLSTPKTVTADLDVPTNWNLDIGIYSDNKLLWGHGDNLVNSDESVTLSLTAGRYYVVVERIQPFNEPDASKYYTLIVRD